MLVFDDGLVNVDGHVQLSEPVDISPCESDADEYGSCLVDGDSVVLFKGHFEVRTWLSCVDFMPKSSTTRQKMIGCHTCHHMPGMCWHGQYPLCAKHFCRSSFAWILA